MDLFGRLDEPTARALVNSYREVAYACATLNASAFAAVPYKLYAVATTSRWRSRALTAAAERHLAARGYTRKLAAGVVELVEHPALDLFERVNSELDGHVLFELTDLYQEFLGTAYWYMDRDALGVPRNIWPLETQSVTPKRDQGYGVTRYIYGAGNNEVELSPEAVVPFRFPSIRDPYGEGYPPARAAWESMRLLENEHALLGSMLDNRARPDYALVPKAEGGISAEVADRTEERMRKKFRQRGAGGPIVFEESFDLKPLNFPTRDLEMLAFYSVSKTAVANSFGVPMSKLETREVNRANAEAGDYQHAKNAILPRCRRFEQRVNQHVLPMWDARLFLVFEDPVPADAWLRARVRKVDVELGVETINECRAERGREPVEWGNLPQWRQTPSAVSVTPSEQAIVAVDTCVAYRLKELSLAEARERLIRAGTAPQVADRWLVDIKWLLPAECHHERGCSPPRESWHTEVANRKQGHGRQLPSSAPLWRVLVDLFAAQRREVMGDIKSMKRVNWAKPLDLTSWDKRFAEKARPVMQFLASDSGRETLMRVGASDVAAIWNVQLPQVREAVERASLRFAASTNVTTSLQLDIALSKLREELASGLLGESNTLPELTKRVAAVFDHAETYRAERIAATESSRAVHLGQQIAAKSSGVVKGFRWLLSADACELCQGIASDVPEVPLGEAFVEMGGEYGHVEYPPAHPNCMCTVTEVLDPNALRDREGKE